MYNPNHNHRQYGMCYVKDKEVVTLPLLSVKVIGTLNDLSATIKVSQLYFNANLNDDIEQVTYTFPIPDKASVNSFVMIKSDGSRVIGIVEGKKEAKVTFDEAIEQDYAASLLEEEYPDVFKVSVGNISAGDQITVELSYATELTTDEENDQVRLQIPISVGARYGYLPSAEEFKCDSIQLGTTVNAFELEMQIETANPILKIGSLSHTIETEFGSTSTSTSSPSSHYAKVQLYSRNSLDKDFILTLTSASLDSPRCIAEIHPRNGSLAIALSMVPRFEVEEVIPSQEYVFVVDRSGSMEGSRIKMAKEALVVLLRSLPHKDSYIQVVSFGSHYSSLWKESKPYNQNTLVDASNHVETMQANYGGTEIHAALSAAFASRKTDRPTSLFLLTDGDAWDVEKVLELVQEATFSASYPNSLRIFVLGIGESTSTAMVDGIARVGNGISTYVVDGEAFTGKVARLLKASSAPLMKSVKIDWGIESSKKEGELGEEMAQEDESFDIISDREVEDSKPPDLSKLSFFQAETRPIELSRHLPPPPSALKLDAVPIIQQSPHTLNSIVPGSRLNIYAILSAPNLRDANVEPKSVVISGELASGRIIELVVPIKFIHLVDSVEIPPAIHTLTAKKIIQEFQDGRRGISKDDQDIYEQTIEAEVTRLGKTYSIASKYTSFVAVDKSEIGKPGKAIKKPRPHQPQLLARSYMASSPMLLGAAPPRSMKMALGGGRGGGGGGQGLPPPPPGFGGGHSAPSPVSSSVEVANTPLASPSTSSSPLLIDIARLQNFDGSFDPKLCSLEGININLNSIIESLLPESRILPELESLLATYIGILYLEKKIQEPQEAWEGLHQKGLEYWNANTSERYRGEMELQVKKAWDLSMVY